MRKTSKNAVRRLMALTAVGGSVFAMPTGGTVGCQRELGLVTQGLQLGEELLYGSEPGASSAASRQEQPDPHEWTWSSDPFGSDYDCGC